MKDEPTITYELSVSEFDETQGCYDKDVITESDLDKQTADQKLADHLSRSTGIYCRETSPLECEADAYHVGLKYLVRVRQRTHMPGGYSFGQTEITKSYYLRNYNMTNEPTITYEVRLSSFNKSTGVYNGDTTDSSFFENIKANEALDEYYSWIKKAGDACTDLDKVQCYGWFSHRLELRRHEADGTNDSKTLVLGVKLLNLPQLLASNLFNL